MIDGAQSHINLSAALPKAGNKIVVYTPNKTVDENISRIELENVGGQIHFMIFHERPLTFESQLTEVTNYEP